ncbi:MAG: hypothetical protein LKI80_04485 [Sporolactobacillus sp.]|jgi:hypothetical protein|nr:hypothetical protein [Sporolactobacillus sp.]
MIGLFLAIFFFNAIAFLTNTRLTKNEILHLWTFTIAFQSLVDLLLNHKYQGYWYFTEDVDIIALPALTVLVPPVNMMFVNWYPFNRRFLIQSIYIIVWSVSLILYELVTLLPEPWGYFHYGWWKIYYSLLENPVLLVILVSYYRWVKKIAKE